MGNLGRQRRPTGVAGTATAVREMSGSVGVGSHVNPTRCSGVESVRIAESGAN